VTRTWLAVRPPRRRRPNRHRQPDAEATARRRSPGRRKSFEAGSDGSAGAPIPGTSREARSEVTGTKRDRDARSQRRPNACGRGRQWETARQPTACWSGPGQTPTVAGRGDEQGDERGHEHKSFEGGPLPPLAPPFGEGRVQVTRYSTRMARRRRDSPPTPRPRLGRQTESWRAIGERAGSPGYLAPRSLPLGRHAFASGVPSKTCGEESGSRSPARPIVTASRIGPMPERMSLTLVDSSPITIAGPTPPRDAHSQASLASRHSPLPWPRPRTVGPARRARRRVQSVNQSANHSGAQSGAHS